MTYYVMIPAPLPSDRNALREYHRTESFDVAKQHADAFKEAHGKNCIIESRATVYVTSTIDEAMAEGTLTRLNPTHVAHTTGRDGVNRAHPIHAEQIRRGISPPDDRFDSR